MGNPPLDFDEDTGKPKRLNIFTHIHGSLPQEDTRLDLWYPDSKRKMECVAAYSSLYPLKPPERLGAVFPEMQNLRESISCQKPAI